MRRSSRLTCTTSGGEDSTAHGVSGRICVRFVRRPISVAGCARRASTAGGSSTADYVRSIRSPVTAARPGRERTASASSRTSSHVSVPARPATTTTSPPKTTVAGGQHGRTAARACADLRRVLCAAGYDVHRSDRDDDRRAAVVLPVTFALHQGSLVFRTMPGTKLAAAALDAVVALQADHYASLHDRRLVRDGAGHDPPSHRPGKVGHAATPTPGIVDTGRPVPRTRTRRRLRPPNRCKQAGPETRRGCFLRRGSAGLPALPVVIAVDPARVLVGLTLGDSRSSRGPGSHLSGTPTSPSRLSRLSCRWSQQRRTRASPDTRPSRRRRAPRQ